MRRPSPAPSTGLRIQPRLAALPIALLLMAFTEGGALCAWKKAVWALCYAIGVFSFFAILLPLPLSRDEVSAPLVSWVGLSVAYAVLAIEG